MFVDREEELAALDTHYRSNKAELFILYGRRRVGKTELLRIFCQDKPHVFFVATTASREAQLARFTEQLFSFQNIPAAGLVLPSWENAFERLAVLPGRPIIVLDEFTYLVGGDSAVPSSLQKSWDTTLRHSQVFLILCGSYVGMMEREAMSYRSPLYGRRTGSWMLSPLELAAAAQLVPAYDPVQAIETWAILGGIPYYLETFDDQLSVLANVRRQIMHPRSLLHDEPRLLLMEELREPRNYFSILQAIAHGHTRRNEIAQAAYLPANSAGKYLNVLQGLQIVERQVPITETRPAKSRRGIYRISDPFLRFWFRFVHPFKDRLELGWLDTVISEEAEPHLDSFVSEAFEEAALTYIAQQVQQGSLDFSLSHLGRWWSPQGQIDLVGWNERTRELLVGECKWTNRPIGISILDKLKATVPYLPGGPWTRVTYALFAKSGFTEALQAQATTEDILLIAAEDMLGQSGEGTVQTSSDTR
jgi:AAA+ ATPase superfamily predicted ATPase